MASSSWTEGERPVPFSFEPLAIPEVVLVEASAFEDERGYFMESYRRSAFAAAGIDGTFSQDNHSRSRRGVFRGLHYQNPPAAQAKLVAASRGRIVDVAVDIRKGSPTFGRYVSLALSGEDRRILYVPAGFAHGFLALTDDAEVTYKVTHEYAPECDRGVLWSDPDLGIELPVADPILSDKDRGLPLLRDADNGFVYEADGPR